MSEGPCRGRVPPNLFGRSLAGGLGGSPSRRAPAVLPSPRIAIAAHRLMAAPIRWDGGLGGKGGRRVDTRLWCPRGETGAATAGNERRLATQPGEWRQVARWSGSVLHCPGGFVLCFSFPAVDRTPGWVGRWYFGRSGRSVLPGTRAAWGSSRHNPGSPSSPGASVRECSGLRPLSDCEQPPGRIRL